MNTLTPDRLHVLLDGLAEDALRTVRPQPAKVAVPLAAAAAVAVAATAGGVAVLGHSDTAVTPLMPAASGASTTPTSAPAEPFTLADVARLLDLDFRAASDEKPAFTEEQALAAADDPAAYSLGLHQVAQEHDDAWTGKLLSVSWHTVWVVAAKEEVPMILNPSVTAPPPRQPDPTPEPTLVVRMYDATTGRLLDGGTWAKPLVHAKRYAISGPIGDGH